LLLSFYKVFSSRQKKENITLKKQKKKTILNVSSAIRPGRFITNKTGAAEARPKTISLPIGKTAEERKKINNSFDCEKEIKRDK